MKNFSDEFLQTVLDNEGDSFSIFRVSRRWLVFRAVTSRSVPRTGDECGDATLASGLFFVFRETGGWYVFLLDEDWGHSFDGNLEQYQDLTSLVTGEPSLGMLVARYILDQSDLLSQMQVGIQYAPEEPEIYLYAEESDLTSLIEDDELKGAVERILNGDINDWWPGLSGDPDVLEGYLNSKNQKIVDEIRDLIEKLEDEEGVDHSAFLKDIQDDIRTYYRDAEEAGIESAYARDVMSAFEDGLEDLGWRRDPESVNPVWEIRLSPLTVLSYYMDMLRGDFEGMPQTEARLRDNHGFLNFDDESFNEMLALGLSYVLKALRDEVSES